MTLPTAETRRLHSERLSAGQMSEMGYHFNYDAKGMVSMTVLYRIGELDIADLGKLAPQLLGISL
jgi:hypothetical protein